MIEKWNITIPELTGEEPRAAYIYVPDIIEEDPEARFPVLYMFDGHNVFFDEDATYGKSWGMADFAEAVQLPIIIAAVECNHGPNNDRLREYAPFSFKDRHFGYIRGDGRKTMEWYVNAFKPFIDENFPTLPEREYTFIAGSSMGGLMSLYAVTETTTYSPELQRFLRRFGSPTTSWIACYARPISIPTQWSIWTTAKMRCPITKE